MTIDWYKSYYNEQKTMICTLISVGQMTQS